jgi:hypothetical protein
MALPRAAALSALLAACGTPSTPTPAPSPAAGERGAAGALTQIDFAFQDSSVPPPYHRSWVVTITPSSIRKVVTSYSTVLAETQGPLTAEQFAAIGAALERAQLRVGPEVPEARPGCAGGTGHRLRLARGATVEEGRVYRCGGSDTGTLRGDVAAFSAALAPYLPPGSEGPPPGAAAGSASGG